MSVVKGNKLTTPVIQANDMMAPQAEVHRILSNQEDADPLIRHGRVRPYQLSFLHVIERDPACRPPSNRSEMAAVVVSLVGNGTHHNIGMMRLSQSVIIPTRQPHHFINM